MAAETVIDRRHALRPERITFDPAKKKVVIEREEFRASNFLDRLHRDSAFAIQSA
jgi:hypothetical protein